MADNKSSHQLDGKEQPPKTPLRFHGGVLGALAPFFLFVAGVIALALSGAPDEKGFWPILVAALTLGLLLARDRKAFCEATVQGMAQPLLAIMILAWTLASCIGILMSDTGFIEALIWCAAQMQLGGIAFVAASFSICCLVSASIGTSFGTLLICGPILYPAGALLGADLPLLAGAVLAGATFGDSISPISDTTIASALSQKADIGGTVRSRLKYVLPAAAITLAAFVIAAALAAPGIPSDSPALSGDPRGLPMILVPALVLLLLLRGRPLLHGLLFGLLAGTLLGLALGLMPVERLMSLDPENFTARSFIIDGLNRAVGISLFTFFLLGLVGVLEASGILESFVERAGRFSRNARSAEIQIAAAAGAAVLLTTHSIVAILTVGEFARRSGERFGLHRYRRANLLDLTVVTFPFLLPYCIPVILAGSITSTGADHGIPPVSPLSVGLHNFYSWAILAVLIFSLASGFGRGDRGPD